MHFETLNFVPIDLLIVGLLDPRNGSTNFFASPRYMNDEERARPEYERFRALREEIYILTDGKIRQSSVT